MQGDVDESEVNINNLEIDLLGMLFVIFYVLILFIQFIGMLMHRWGTFLHLIAITEIPNPFGNKFKDFDLIKGGGKPLAMRVLELCEKLDSELLPDYPMDSDDEDAEQTQRRDAVKEIIINLQEKGMKEDLRGTSNPLAKSFRNFSASARNSTVRNFAESMRRTLLARTSSFRDERLLHPEHAYKSTLNIGRTLLNDPEKDLTRRIGTLLPLQKHFTSQLRRRNLPNTPADFKRNENGGACTGIGRTLPRGSYDPDIVETSFQEAEEDIYDTIGTMSKAFSRKFLKFKSQQHNRQRRQPAVQGVSCIFIHFAM